MIKMISAALAVAFATATFDAPAQIVDHNDLASVSAQSSRTVRLAPSQTQTEPFSVRYVDATGRPLQGLAVSFLVDECGASGVGPPDCPPHDIFGHFVPPMSSDVHTDANGVATSNAFVAGDIVGTYDVAAVAFSFAAENAALGGDIGLFFQIQQADATQAVPITAAFTGAWYDPGQSGHGLLIEVLPADRILAFWFTFDAEGKQAWFGGDGVIEGDIAFIHVMQGTGGKWIPNFAPSEYQQFPWGNLTLTFTDCNHGRVDFAGNGDPPLWGVGHMDLTRLAMPSGLSCD